MTPQAAAIQQVVSLVESLGANEIRVLHQILGERLNSTARMVPELFVDRSAERMAPQTSFVPDSQDLSLPGVARAESQNQNSNRSLDVFSKSEKWLAPAPTPDTSKWTSRESEVLGWSDYLSQLSSWAAQGSLDFATEINHASRWPAVVSWQSLSQQQKARATRVVAVLRAAFTEHARTSMLINVFLEGISLQEAGGSFSAIQASQGANGYELLRQLTLEYSLRTRSEALSMRAGLASRTFSLSAAETSPTTVVSDVIRRIDFEAARFAKIVATLPSHVDQNG